jgi:hypothetical protein
VELVVLSKSRHYYLPTYGKWAFEVHAWLHDRHLASAPPFHVLHFHDGHGLAYYAALARAQRHEVAGLTNTRVVVNVHLPLVWLATLGGGGGLHSVDDLEVNFMEQESARCVYVDCMSLLVPSSPDLCAIQTKC